MTDDKHLNVPCGACEYDPTLPISGSWYIELPLAAVSQNALKSNMPGRRGFKYRKFRDDVAALVAAATKNVPKASNRRRVFFTRYFASPARPFDRDNLIAGFKPVRDCLTAAALIVDDKDKWLEAHYRQVKSDRNFMTIEIEDILGW